MTDWDLVSFLAIGGIIVAIFAHAWWSDAKARRQGTLYTKTEAIHEEMNCL